MSYLLIGFGGALGAICRYYLGIFVAQKAKTSFPLGTWIINGSGSFLLGLLFNFHIDGRIEDWVMLLFGVGFCGAYTTYSTFGNETVQLLVSNQGKTALLYVGSSVLITCLAAFIGLVI